MTSYAILGWGVANRAVYRYLLSRPHGDIRIYVSESEFDALHHEDETLPLVCGFSDIGEDVLVRSPGMRPDLSFIRRALARGARLTGEIEIFINACPAPIYGVTGSDGKTTTATIAAEMFRVSGHTTYLGGNIGVSLLPFLDRIKSTDRVVLELSSFQLMGYAPRLAGAVVTNLTENHLNWHTDMREYQAAKSNILTLAARRVQNARHLIMPHISSLTFSAYTAGANYHLTQGYLMHGDTRLVAARDVTLRGMHNIENILAAAALTDAGQSAVYEIATTFAGVAHRMEYCGIYRGVKCYNSSIDTTPARTAATLAAIGTECTVIAGGQGKNLSYAPLAEALAKYAARVVFTGEDGEAMQSAFAMYLSQQEKKTPSVATVSRHLPQEGGSVGEDGEAMHATLDSYLTQNAPLSKELSPQVTEGVYVRDFKEAVHTALAMTPAGGTLILSPAATSFDAFSSYTARGDAFRACLETYK